MATLIDQVNTYDDAKPKRNVFQPQYIQGATDIMAGNLPNQQAPQQPVNNTVRARANAFNANQQQMAQNAQDNNQQMEQNQAQQNAVNTKGAHGYQQTTQTANTQPGQPVKKNIFSKSIEGRQAEADNRSRATDNQFLDAIASDNLEKQRYNQDVADYNQNMMNGTYASHENWAFAPKGSQYNTDNVQKFNDEQSKQTPFGTKRKYTDEEFRQALNDEYEQKMANESDKRAKIMAVGDALRNIGNLYYTTKGATPQQYSTSPALQEREQYKADKAQRDALTYRDLQQRQKQAQQQYENELKARKDARDQAESESNIAYKDAGTKQILQNMGYKADEHPYEMQKLVGDAAEAIANGRIKDAEAGIKELELKNTPEAINLANGLKKAQIAQSKASAAASYASAENSRANAAKNWADAGGAVAENGGMSFPVFENGKYSDTKSYHIKGKVNDVKAKVVSELGDWARKQGWVKGGSVSFSDVSQMSNGELSNVYDAIITHTSDTQVQRGLAKLERQSNGGGGSSTATGRPGTTVKKGNNGGGGSSTRQVPR